MSNKKTITLYSNTENGMNINIKCIYTLKTNNIGISTIFTKKGYRKTKSLYCKARDGITTHITCSYNPKTDHIGIITSFTKTSNGGSKTNKTCSNYLGITVGERILSHIFKNVKRMSSGNPGFDFICNSGYKIDVKCSTLSGTGNQWAFKINKNTIADYFLCLGFDNREDLNPQHLWLIPGKILNNKINTSIAKSTLSNWSDYEITDKLHDVMICCNTLRNI